MANPIPCDMGCGLVAVFMVGNMETGDQTAFCTADFARAGLAVAAAQLPREEVLAALGVTEAPAAEDGKPDKAPKTRKGRKAAETPEPPAEPETPERVEEAAATTPDGGT